MSVRIIFLEEFGKAFVPKKFIPNLRKYFRKGGYSEVPYKFFGLLFYISAALTTFIFISYLIPRLEASSLLKTYSNSIIGVFIQFVFSTISWFFVQLFFVTLFILLIYFYVDLSIYQRTKRMEEQLPDFLQVLSSNLKGGMTFENALWAAIKPRFDVLGAEMARASKRVMTGSDIADALNELSEKYDSLMLRRTVDLMISEVESGGNVANLIDRIVDNLKQTKELKDEMSASAIAYVIFISIIVVIISPLLFALSFNLLVITLNFIGKIATATTGASSLPFNITQTSINPDDFKIFSVLAITIIALFSSMIVSIVEKGDIKGGLKYIPIYVLGSAFFYFIFMKILKIFLGGISFS